MKNLNLPASGIPVKNAGIVILNSYLPILFERLELISNNKFKTIDTQIASVHYLHYLATGLQSLAEYMLPLNKVMCGLPISDTITDGITISEADTNLINGLINAAISHWPSVGKTSIDGFRGNWLIRDGILTETEDKWELTVEKRAYDLLLNRSPFSFYIIKYQWMPKPLHVIWN